jgi:hypothetical protein
MTARTFALLMGIAFAAAGVLGFVPAFVAPPEAGDPQVLAMSHGRLFGLFPVNALHNAVHLAIGLWGFAAWAGMAGAVAFARSLSVLYLVLAVAGLVPQLNTMFGLVPIHGHDVWLHAGTALLAAWFGWGAPARDYGYGYGGSERRLGTERRGTMTATGVVVERRMRIDRRRGEMATTPF